MILVLAGTKDGREIIKRLQESGRALIASVVTDYGYQLLNNLGVRVIKGRLDQQEMKDLIEKEGITLIIDATHPFAQEVSRNAITVSRLLGIDYIRFEREEITLKDKTPGNLLIRVKNYREAALAARDFEKILLTIGSNNIHYFIEEIKDWQEKLIVRILPDSSFIKKIRDLGFAPANIIAMQGPFSKELNKVLIRDYEIKVLVTKASGRSGGLDTKLKAAFELGIPVIMIERPGLAYPKVVCSCRELVNKLEEGKMKA